MIIHQCQSVGPGLDQKLSALYPQRTIIIHALRGRVFTDNHLVGILRPCHRPQTKLML